MLAPQECFAGMFINAVLNFRARNPSSAAASAVAAPRRQIGDERLAGAVTGLAALAALAVALAFPAAYFISAYDRLIGEMEARAEIYADSVSGAAAESPELFNAFLGSAEIDLTGLAIAAQDDAQTMPRPPERRRVFAADGHVILDVPTRQPLAWPTLSRRMPVTQNGNRLGDIEIVGSLRPQLLVTLAVAAGSFTLGMLLLMVLRVIPLRLMRDALDRASFLSLHDQLTGLPNRSLLADRLEQALSSSRCDGARVALFCLDLDHFKEVNDTLGHAAGDALLRTIVARLRACIRGADTLARLGGDEFAVVAPAIHKPLDAEALANRFIEAARDPVTLDGQQVFIGMSAGIAFSAPDLDAAELTKQADVALYQAKAAGRGGYCFFAPEMNAGLQRRRMMGNELRAAFGRGELAIHYQPQIELATGKILGAEALMRWIRAGEVQAPPETFIPVAEENGLIGKIGAWLLQAACRDAAGWPASMTVAVNISPVQFRLSGFLGSVRAALAETGLDPRRLELEITEGVLLNDTEETLAILGKLRAIGVRLAMDDFGTGNSSLGYLQKFRFDKIKIDRSFVQNLGADPNAAAIVRAVVGLGDALGAATNAEGVESDEQAKLLRGHGCHEVQGFLYWRPMPADAIRTLLDDGHEVDDIAPSALANISED